MPGGHPPMLDSGESGLTGECHPSARGIDQRIALQHFARKLSQPATTLVQKVFSRRSIAVPQPVQAGLQLRRVAVPMAHVAFLSIAVSRSTHHCRILFEGQQSSPFLQGFCGVNFLEVGRTASLPSRHEKSLSHYLAATYTVDVDY